jgi:predicted nucleic acid-binding protein
MSGKLIDLSQSNVLITEPVVADTSVVVALLLEASLSVPLQSVQALSFFQQLLSRNQQVLVTPTIYSEFLHIAIKFHYTTVYKAHGKSALTHRLGVPIRSWHDLFKHDPALLQRYASELSELRRALIAHNIVVMDPENLGLLPSGRTHQEELLRVVSHYGLDTNDALILMDASRLGVRSIVTFDRAMLRARADFDILTWL